MAEGITDRPLPYRILTTTKTTDSDGVTVLELAAEWNIPIGVRINMNQKIVNLFTANSYWYAKVVTVYGNTPVANTEITFKIAYL